MFSSFYAKNEESKSPKNGSKKKGTPTKKKKSRHQNNGDFQAIVTVDPHLMPMEMYAAPQYDEEANRHMVRTSTFDATIAEAAEGVGHEDGPEISVINNRGDGRDIKFKKAKRLKKVASKHYLKHLESKMSRFKDWKRDEMIEVIVGEKFIELRNERQLDTDAIRSLCDSLYAKEAMPKKPIAYNFSQIVERIVAARRIQNTWIVYQAIKREMDEQYEANVYNNRINDYDESNIEDLGRAELMMMTEENEVNAGHIEDDLEAGKEAEGGEDGAVRPPRIKAKRNILDLPWTPPDYQKAIAYGNYVQPRKGGKGGNKFDFMRTTTGRHCVLTGFGEQFDLWDEGQVSEFSPFGPGITNYFKFLKWAFWIFVLMTIAALPVLVINMNGNSTNSGLSTLARTTIGNLAVTAAGELVYDSSLQKYNITTTAVVSEVNVKLPGCSNYGLTSTSCYLDGDTLALFYAVVDIIVASILFIGYVWLSVFEKFEERQLSQNTVLASHYTLKVSRFPPETTEDQLKTHFSRLVNKKGTSAVAEVSFAYNNSGEILMCKARGDIIRKKVRLVHEHRFKCTNIRERTDLTDEKKQEKVDREREKMKATMNSYNEDLKRKDKALEELSQVVPTPIAAFVTFNYTTDAKIALEKYNHSSFITLICGNPLLNLNGKHLRVRAAPEPSVIVWENMEYTETDRFLRNFATFLLSLLLIAISLAMIFSSKYLEQTAQNNGSSSSTLCPTNFDSFSYDEKIQIMEEYPSLLQCFCDRITLTSASSICANYYQNQARAQVLTYFASFIVIVVNNLIVRVVRYSAKFEKHHSSDGLSMSVFFRLFFLKYINTAAVFLINNNNVILQKIFGLVDTTSSSNVEFDTNWYNTIAVTIVLVQLGDAFNAQAENVRQYYFLQRRKKMAKADPKCALTQDELNKMHVGPEFEFAFNYAQMLSTFFVCLTFSTGIPILYPIAAFNFMLFYFMEKYMFIHLYKIPPHFTTLLGQRVTSFIPIAILLHLAMSIWVLSNNELFATQSLTTSSDTLVSAFQFGGTIQDRIRGRATFPIFMTFCAIIVLHLMYFYYKYSRQTLNGCYDFLFGFVTIRKQEAKIKRANKDNWKAKVPFARAVMRNLIKGLSSYNILRNPEYKEAFGITWKFAVENKDVRAVRRMKAKAQATLEDEDAEKAEELQRLTLTGSAPPSRKLRSPRGGNAQRNRSFYGAVSGTETRPSPRNSTPVVSPPISPRVQQVEMTNYAPSPRNAAPQNQYQQQYQPQYQQAYPVEALPMDGMANSARPPSMTQAQQQAYYAQQQQQFAYYSQQQQQQAYYAQQQQQQQQAYYAQQQYRGSYQATPQNGQNYRL